MNYRWLHRFALPHALLIAIGLAAALIQLPEEPAFAQAQSTVADVTLSTGSFNPSLGDKVTLSYTLAAAAVVTVRVYDADQSLVRVLIDQARQGAGAQRATWDGRDMDGQIVPNEAYVFTVEAKGPAAAPVVYDPITFSGGEPFDLGTAQVSRQSGTLAYKLSQPSRVLVRIGIPGSALLRTLVDWEPRKSGDITEYWNGKDQDDVMNVVEQDKYRVLIAYFTLPDTSVITFGNDKVNYRAYKARLAGRRPSRPSRPMANARRLSPQFMAPRKINRDFQATIRFPEVDRGDTPGVPSLKNRALARVEIPAADREVITGRQFEIILFVDTTYVAEEERGYVPFNFPLELDKLAAGEHVVTVNIVTFDGQIGIGSRKIRVVR